MNYEALHNTDKDKNIPETKDAELERTVDELSIIAQRIGGDLGMDVKLGKVDGGSFYNPDNISITLDPKHIKEDPSLAKFVVAHEGGHRAITRSPKELGLPKETTEKLYSQIGFAFTQNAIEDPADNDWVRNRFPGLDSYVKENYDKSFKEENAVLSTPEVREIAKQLGYWPKFSQYGSEVIRFWHQNKFSKKLDPSVKEALKKTIKETEKSISSIPSTQYNETEIINKAQDRFRINTENIWPHVKKLTEEDLLTENQRQIAQEINDKVKEVEKKKQEQQQAQGEGNESKDQGLQKEIDKIKESLESAGISEEIQQEIENKIKQAEKELGQEDKEGSDKKSKKQVETEKNKQSTEEKGELKEALGPPVPMDKFSDELKEKLQEYFDSLPEDKQEEIKKRAKRNLERFEDEINKKFEGRLNKNKPENHNEREETKNKERKRQKDAALKSEEVDADEKERKEKLEKIQKEMMSEYEKSRAEVVGLVDYLYLRLRRILKPEEYGGQETGYPSGKILEMARAMQAESNVAQKQKMWIRESAPERQDYRFWHLVDLSGSMDGDPIEEAFKGFIVASEAVDRIEDFNSDTVTVRQGITGFHNRVFEYKDYKERFTKTLEKRLSEMIKRPDDNDAGTNTYKGTMVALENLKKDLGTSGNFLLTFSDGAPNYDMRDGLEQLIKDTKEDREKKKIKIGLIWLGDSEEELKELTKEYGYDFGLMMPAVKRDGEKNFAESLSDLLEDIVKNPEKY